MGGPKVRLCGFSLLGPGCYGVTDFKTRMNHFRQVQLEVLPGLPILTMAHSAVFHANKKINKACSKQYLATLLQPLKPVVLTYYGIFPRFFFLNYLLDIFLSLLASLQNGADGLAGSEASHVGPPGSGALEAPGGERGSGTMSGLSGPLCWPGPRPCALLFLFLLGPSSVLAISFHLPVNSRKCLREEIHKDLLVTGAYEITDQSGGAGGLRTHLKVRPGAARGRPARRPAEAGVGAGRRAGGGREARA